jgi:hypothetical protein
LKFPPFFGQVVKPRFWHDHGLKIRRRGDGNEATEALG